MTTQNGMPKKALFLDRDGVINEDTHYPHKPEHIIFKPGIFDFCRAAAARGYILVVVTNQAGVAKGRFTEQDVCALHLWMKRQFADRGIDIAGFYYCPYHKNAAVPEYRRDSDSRKPKPGMFLAAARELGIDLRYSIMVGDKPSDRIELPEMKSYIIKGRGDQTEFDFEKLEDVLSVL